MPELLRGSSRLRALSGFLAFMAALLQLGSPAAIAARLKRWQGAGFRRLAACLGLRQNLEVDGRRISLSRAALEVTRHTLLQSLTPTVTVSAGDTRYAFRCTTHAEFVRAYTMLEREPGTSEWLRHEVRPDDVVYDIGANIGAVTFIAARRISNGLLYAFEPHLANASSLLANLKENGVGDIVRVLASPLSERSGVFGFDYRDIQAGTALSQLGAPAHPDRPSPTASPELKLVTTIDELLEAGTIRAADIVKLDVDGQELKVLLGMRNFLTSADRPRAVQVEVHPGECRAICELMRSCGYELTRRHLSAGAMKAIEAGTDHHEIPFNGIFRPAKSGSPP